jgi:hypothetical protein
VQARITVDGDGDVVDSSFSGDQRDLVRCVQDTLRGFHIEGLSGGPRIVVVHYVFEGFAPKMLDEPQRHRSLASFVGCL